MNKIKINAIMDSKMDRVPQFEPGKIPTTIEYVTGQTEFDGITVFTDKCFDDSELHIIDKVNSLYKLAWMHEPRFLGDWCNKRYINLENNLHKFDKVMTYDEYLLDTYPTKTIFTVDNGIWVSDDEIKIHDKTKVVSMIYSWKQWTEGHKLRHQIANLNIKGLDLYGSGSKHPIKFKEDGLKQYQYSIVIENSRSKYYYTEKLLDCFAVGTIPIYWGCKNIGDYFDIRGIIQFEKIEDLEEIFKEISNPETYHILFPFVKINFELVKEYIRYEDWIYKNVYTNILGEHK